ncbi:MAG: cytidylate kinase-like family protein [Phycisphaerae bacterium]|nr:cytidylate kinase-like family protein [Phycisphaerae bacterium]
MAPIDTGGTHPLAEVAHHRLRRWLGMKQIRERADKPPTPEQVARHLGPYIAISREEGAGGHEIARLVARKLGWDILDRELLEFMAEHYDLPRKVVEFVDESTANWLGEVFNMLIDPRVISQQAYVKRLGHILLLAAYHGKVVIVGRGAQFLLPREKGFAVRVLAPEAYRIEQVMRRENTTREAAQKLINELESNRSEFVKRYFHQDLADPHVYDLIVNVGKCGTAGAVDLIASAVTSWLKVSGIGSETKT